VSPFVGHNVILSWTALQEVSDEDEDGYVKFWSESHVSEDFGMSLRLQVADYIIRLTSYTGDGFKEGVPLTVYDELNRWEKYAYGCNELLVHSFRVWVTRGPFTPFFRKFIISNIRLISKIIIIVYIGIYYAIGVAWILTVLNYFLIGWYNGYLDHYYIDSFKVYFSLILVFSSLGNIVLPVLRYRLSEKSLIGASKLP
jgi:cellulose synthase/poly-beta-1,6-N-acetylglucosamine synthase-like glycosyltransferase